MSPSFRKRVQNQRAVLSLLIACVVLAGCNAEPSVASFQNDESSAARFGAGSCKEEGRERECGVTLERANGIMACYRGRQLCAQGSWSACQEGFTSTEPDPFGGFSSEWRAFSNMALSDAQDCSNSSLCDGYREWRASGSNAGSPGGTSGAAYELAERVSYEGNAYQCIHLERCNAEVPGSAAAAQSGWRLSGACTSLNPCDPYCKYFDEDPDDITTSDAQIPVVPAYPALPPQQLCAHDLCTTGAGLTRGCTECVTSVCAALPACCDVEWTEACVLEAFACENKNPPTAGPSLCSFGIFSETGVTLANRSSTNAVIGANGNVSVGTDAEVSGIFATGNIDFPSLNNQTINAPSGIWADGNISNQNSNSQVNASFFAGGSIELTALQVSPGFSVNAEGAIRGSNQASIYGSAAAQGNIGGNNPNDLTLNGSVCQNDPACYVHQSIAATYDAMGNQIAPGLVPQEIPVLATECDGTAGDLGPQAHDETVVLTPGLHYKKLKKNNWSRVVWRFKGQGTYYIQSADIGQNSVFYLDTAGQALEEGWQIRICGDLKIDGGGFGVVVADDQRDSLGELIGDTRVLAGSYRLLNEPRYLSVYSGGSITANADAYFSGIWLAPQGTIQRANMNAIANILGTSLSRPSAAQVRAETHSAPVNGGIWGARIIAGTDALTRQISEEDCELMDIPGVNPPPLTEGECPLVGQAPAVPAAITEPCVTGQDCQINHRCQEPKTEDCSHSKCISGAPLGADCDACVERICAESPECCEAAWSSECVAQVATVCDATCADASCAHGACKVGDALEPACGPCIASVCAVDESCCSGAWTSACVELTYDICGEEEPLPEYPEGTSICDYAVYGLNEVFIGKNGQYNRLTEVRGGWIGSERNASMNVSYSQLNGKLTISGSLNAQTSTLYGEAQVCNSGFCGPSLLPQQGDYTQVSDLPSSIDFTPLSQSCPNGPSTPPGGWSATTTEWVLLPGDYGDVAVPTGSTLTLSAGGRYRFSSLHFGGTAGMAPDTFLSLPNTGSVEVYSCADLKFSSGSSMTGRSSTSVADVFFYAQGDITLGGTTRSTNLCPLGSGGQKLRSTYYGSMIALGDIEAHNCLDHFGLLGARGRADVGHSVLVDASQSQEGCLRFMRDAAPPSPQQLCSYTLYSQSWLNLNDGAKVKGGNLGSQQRLNFKNRDAGLSDAQVRGDIYTNREVIFADNGLLDGSIQSSIAPQLSGRETITGSTLILNQPSLLPTQMPDLSSEFKCSSSTDLAGSTTLTLSPNTPVRNVSVQSGQTLELTAPGDYQLGSLRVSGDGKISLPVSGQVRLFVCGVVEVLGNASFLNINSADAGRLLIVTNSPENLTPGSGFQAVKLSGSSAPRFGTYLALRGSIYVGRDVSLYGALWGRSTNIDQRAEIDSSSVTGENCSLIQANDLACPVEAPEPVLPDEQALCLPNAPGYQDETCQGYDLALGVPCADELPICNHGTASFNGTVQVGYYAESSRQMAQEFPPAPDGSCLVSLSDLEPGSCQSVSCALPTSEIYTLMLDPEAELATAFPPGECDQRRLDNWTVHDGRSCDDTRGPIEARYVYEAECPLGSQGVWSVLNWTTETPGDSTIEFRARIAESESALSGDFTLLGKAQASPSDTQRCLMNGDIQSGCPVDISDKLSLPQVQGQVLELKIDLLSSEQGPVLKDWQVSYSCQFYE